MNRSNVVSFLIGAAVGFLGLKFVGSRMQGTRMLGAPNRRGLGVTEYVGLTDWDTEQRALALTRSLEGVYRLGDVPSSFYGGESMPPSFEGLPDFLNIYDPDGPKYSEFGSYPWNGPFPAIGGGRPPA